MDSRELIPQSYVSKRAGSTTLFLLGSWHPYIFLQILARSKHLGPTRIHRAGIFKQSKDLGFFSANGLSPDTEKGTKSR